MTEMVLLSEWMSSQVEFWKPIPYVDGYDVSNFGRVRSWRTVKPRKGGGTQAVRRKVPRILKASVPKTGYPVVGIGRLRYVKGHYGRRPVVHRLVALAFLPNPEGLPTVNHLTGLRTDNRLDNLAWASRAEQARHAWAYGLHKRDVAAQARKMVNARKEQGFHLPDEFVRLIRNLLNYGFSQGQVRRWSGLDAATIQSIAVGRTYKDVA